jgi:hypothetical protein
MQRVPKFVLAATVALCMFTACASDSAEDLEGEGSDARALKIAKSVMKALGGRGQFNAVRYLSFHFVVERDSQRVSDWRHDWNRQNNDYRLEGKNDKGDELLMVFNLLSRDGEAYKNGLPVEGEERRVLLEFAYGRFINDTYWLLMPYKLRDPGVMLTFDGEEVINNQRFEVIKLRFAPSVGLTPQNVYRVFVDPSTSRIHRWEYFPEEGKEPRPAWWNEWREFGNVTLALERKFDGRNARLLFEGVAVSNEAPAGLFIHAKGIAARFELNEPEERTIAHKGEKR